MFLALTKAFAIKRPPKRLVSPHCLDAARSSSFDPTIDAETNVQALIAIDCLPDDPERALASILKTADIQSNFVERFWMSSRRKIAAGVLRQIASQGVV